MPVKRPTSEHAQNDDARVRPDFVPADRYRGEDVFKLEKERLWPHVWQVVCRVEELAEVGEYVRYDICDEPLIVVRSSASEIKAFYNVCQHRGRRLVDKEKGSINGFFCRFHGWKWSLDGSLVDVPHREKWSECSEFADEELALPQPQCSEWGGWVWINLDPEAEPLVDFLGEAARVLDPFDLADLRRAWHVALIAPVNWKVVVEAFNEGYHAGTTHISCLEYLKMTSPVTAYGPHAMYHTIFGDRARAKREDGSWKETESPAELIYYQSLELYTRLEALVMEPQMKAIARVYEEMKDAPAEDVYQRIWDLHKEELEATGAQWPPHLTPEQAAAAGTSWQIFPNTIMFPVVDGVLWYRMRPDARDADQCIFDIWCLRRYAVGQEPAVETQVFDGFEAARGVNPFLEEDFANMIAVNAGMKSRGWRGARTNPEEELTVSHFHRHLAEYLSPSG
jgi:phenylpropionate dioxygenase-like ring-hydroxylating dioxygenase large terminal subunit